MRIGIPRESDAAERRVAATPSTASALMKLGYEIAIEHDAGSRAAFPDSAYEQVGCSVVDADQAWGCEVILKIAAPTEQEIARLRSGTTLACLLSPAMSPELLEALATRGVTALAMDAVPRISRAQSLDVLSSMANLAGYRAVVEAAHEFGSLFTGQVTAAGKVPPAKVLVVGAGVAGLAAIGTAASLGAMVRGFDARPEVADQVESMGGEFLRIDVERSGPSTDGYARETGEDFNAKAAALYTEQAKDVDIIITTALIPGKPAPRLITADMVASMKPGSVVVDMAAASGGNVEGSLPGQSITTANGVKIIGYTDLPSRLPTQASQLYGTNQVNLLKLLTPDKDGQLRLNFDDEVQRAMTVTHQGKVIWPPPPVQVSATPPPAPEPEKSPPEPRKPMPRLARLALLGFAAVGFLGLSMVSPEPFLGHFMVFMLSVVIGFYVIGSVHHALHTPLMSVTNAISGIIVLGALLQIGHSIWVTVLAFIAILVASINVFGGFTVTARMLEMFKREEAVR